MRGNVERGDREGIRKWEMRGEEKARLVEERDKE